MLDLRTGLAAPSDLLNYADEGLAASYRAIDAAGANPIKRGWVSTSEGLQGSDLLAEANAAERAGDMLRAQQLELQAQDHMQRAQTWAPTTQNFTDIDGLGAAANWLGGQVGSGTRSMIAPLAGGVGGRVLGGLAGGLIAGPAGAAIGANLGGIGGAFGPSYDMQYNESVGQHMMDPEIRAKRTAEEIHRTGQKVGAVGGALEAIVPAGIAKAGMGGIGKRTIGGVMAREAGEEALTEGAQSYVGQTGQNQLAGRELTDYDHRDAFNAAMAGAVGGGVMGGAGAAVGAARDKLAAGGEKVAKAASDPVQTVVDAVHRAVKGDPIKRADREIAEFESGQRSLSKMFEDERTTANDERIFDAPKADEPDAQVSARMREDIDRWADRILTAKPRELGPREEELRSAAAQYKSDGDWMKLRGVLRKNKLTDERSSMMNSFEPEGAKASEMTPEGQELDALSNAWLKNEGKRYGEYFADGSDEAKGLGAKLFGWIKNDFGAKMTDDGEIFIPRAFIEALGDRAPGVVESAITAARKEGWDIKNAGDAVATIRQYVNSNEGDTSFLTSAIRYSQQENWTPKMIQRFAKELRQKGGRLDKDDYRWLKTQVGDIVGVLEHFQKPSRFYKAEKNQLLRSGSPKTQADMDVDGESLELSVDRDGEVVSESSTASAGITDNDGDWGSSVSEFDGDSKPTFIGNTLEGYPFDTTDERQVAKKNAKLGEYANDPAAFAREVGVWQQAKRAAKGNQALLTEYEDALIREHGNSLSDARFEGELNPVDLDDGERKSILSQINKRFRMVEVETTKSANDMAFDKKDVHLEKADPRDQNLGPSKGILRFMRYNKDGSEISRPFVTSTQMLISKMFKSQDSMAGSTKYYEGTAQQLLQHLSDGVASLLQDKSFGGEGNPAKIAFTVKSDGTPRWVSAKDIKSWPKNLALFRDKEGRQHTLGEALAQIDEQAKKSPKEMRNELRTINWNLIRKAYEEVDGESKKVAWAKVKEERASVTKAIEGDNDAAVKRAYDRYSDFIPSVPSFTLDFDPDTLNPHNKLAIKEKKPWEKAEDLKQLLDLTTDKELRGRIVRARRLAGKRDFADSNALWNELVDSGKLQAAGIVTDVEVGRGNQVEEGQVGPDDLSAYDPDYIKRTDDGRMRSKSIEYEAQSVIGTSKKVDQKDAAKFEPALKTFPTLTSTEAQNFSAEKLQAAKDWVVSTMRGGVEPLITAIGKMDLTQLRITDAALFGRETVIDRKSRVSDPNVSAQKVDATEVAELVKRTGVSEKVAEGMLRRGDKTIYTRVYDKDIGGIRTKEAGETQAITKQVGLLDLHQTKLAKDYFNGSLREALAFLKTGQENQAVIKSALVKREGEVANGQLSNRESDQGAVDTRGQADTGGEETGVVAQPGRERATENSELGAGQQGRSAEDGVAKNSEQTTSDIKPIDPEQALADIARMLGKDFDAKVVEKLGGKAGTWTPGIIRMATSAVDGVQFHEALHELFNQMRTHGAANVAQIIERVANSPLILRKLEQLLSDHPKAIKQLKSPEEAAAYLFQFWNMGLINVGPETKSLFQTIKDLIVDAAKELHSWVNAAKRDERKTEKAQKMDEAEVRRLFEALAGGAAATSDVNVRQTLYDGLRKNIEAHTKAVEDLGQRVEGFWQGIGRYVVTSESMLNLYSKHPELKSVADKFHQMAGKSMKNQARNASLMARGGLIEAKHAEVQRRLNPFERFLMDGKYDEKDMALAAKHLEANTKSADKKINDLIDFVHKFYGEMYDYMVQSDVRRLDPHSEERWVPIQKRKDYFTQSWSIEELTKDHDGFVGTLLAKHAKELAHMAQQANAEIAAWNKDPKTQVESATAKVELDAAKEQNRDVQEITPEMIAEQIYVRLLNSTGMVDIQETNWSLGLTPAAGAVNRRELDWLDKEAFSKYKSKDLVEIVTNYTRTMVSRAEYQKRFGYGGEVIGDAMDTAMLREMGGQALVDSANASLDGEIKRWKKDARAWYKDNPGVPYAEPYPTLRLVGIQQHRAQVGADASNEALIKAEKTLRPAINAVRAMEGTLGNDISPAMRSVNSWINTYQNVRLLPLALFTNFSDVIGITANGGTLGDAWNAFTAGMREVRNTWVNEKGSDSATLRAEEWGVSDAGAMLDTLGQNYSSVYMTEKARNINNKFFRIIGMEGWNRGVRITATAVGERIIGDWVKNGVDAKKPGEKARFERLFGEGADPKKIKLDAQGNLDTQDADNRAAIQRFVQDSVMSSNSAVRAIWMSDPRMATFAHLKNFAYAFHSVMLKGILAQAAEGNLRPALVAGLGFASISIAAAAVKEMLIPGDEPYWMKGGLDGYLEYGYNMANLGGVPQMYLESVTDFDPAKLAGPFWDQIQNTLSSPIPGFGINISPVDGETEILRDRKVMVELAKALPAGNLAGRAMDSLVGD